MDPLDNPIWEALRTRQAVWAEGNQRARRFPPAMTGLGGLESPTPEAYACLAALQKPGEPTGLFLHEPPAPPPGWQTLTAFALPQMVHDDRAPAEPGVEALTLGAADSPEMEALALLTKPGPFGPRTHELGTYLGIRREGRLVAMAGERLQLPGYTEISAVCTHPDATGQGLAAALVSLLVARIQARGETPILHVHPENERAIALYRRLGFVERRRLNLVVLKSN